MTAQSLRQEIRALTEENKELQLQVSTLSRSVGEEHVRFNRANTARMMVLSQLGEQRDSGNPPSAFLPPLGCPRCAAAADVPWESSGVLRSKLAAVENELGR